MQLHIESTLVAIRFMPARPRIPPVSHTGLRAGADCGKLRPPQRNELETMRPISRRVFLAGSAAAVAAPAVAAPASVTELDIVIVGAGAAGIAAARRIIAAGRHVTIFEARDRIGGRCITDMRAFGVPFDRGAHWIPDPDTNPLARLATRPRFEIYPAPPGQKLRIARRYAREGEMEDFLANWVRTSRVLAETGRKAEQSCAQALPKDLGDWRPTIEFALGPYACGKDLADLSAADYARSAERSPYAFCRQGFGSLLAGVGANLPVRLSTPVNRIDWDRGLDLYTDSGQFAAAAVIVTASTNVLAGGRIKFTPGVPKRQLDAAARLSLGTFEHIALELAGNPLNLQHDEIVLEKSETRRTAGMLANMGGTPVHLINVGGRFGRELAVAGEPAMVAFATDWLVSLYGSDVRKAIKRTAATRWGDEPWILGAFSAAAPGGQPSRRILAEPVGNKIWFAGEATHETLWGTVAGAWESGERAADAVLRRLGVLKDPEQAKRGAPPPKKPVRRRARGGA
jgi:monoamine oxidase